MKLKRIFAGLLAVGILPSMAISTAAVPTDTVPVPSPTVGSSDPTDNGKTYSLDEVYTDYLFKHNPSGSDHSDDRGQSDMKKSIDNASSDEVYKSFGLTTQSDQLMKSTSDDPMNGYSYVLPQELVFHHINAQNDSKNTGVLKSIDNVNPEKASLLSNVDSLATSGNPIALNHSDVSAQQTNNCIGIDYNNDGVDELAYFMLYANGGKGYARITLYARPTLKGSGNLSDNWTQTASQDFEISDDDDIKSIEAHSSKGYTAMTAGDFDGDGKEELAVYLMGGEHADSNNDNRYVPKIAIMDIDGGSINFNHEIRLPDIRSELGNLDSGKNAYDGWHSPTVALSTTHIRSNAYDDYADPNTKENAEKKSYDDLVINVTVPRNYTNDNVNMNSLVAIYSFNSKTFSYEQQFYNELYYDNYRMICNNSVDADLNADGYDELVVAGLCETGLNGQKSSGNISTENNLVQIISWFGDEKDKGYKAVWSKAQTIEAAGGGKEEDTGSELNHFNVHVNVTVNYNSQEPIALTAGRYDKDTPITQDYLCVQGVIFRCDNAKLYGKDAHTPDYYANGGGGSVQLITMPYHDDQNYKDAVFTKLYKFNLQKDKTDAHSHNPFISTADSGVFYNAMTGVDTIVMLTGDSASGNHDLLNYDIVFIYYENGEWHSQVHNDYFHHSDEDDNGTSASLAFANTDKDEMYYRLRDKTLGYSSPTLYSVVQAPPYYAENNKNGTMVSYTITHATSSGDIGNWGLGLSLIAGFYDQGEGVGPVKVGFDSTITAGLNYVGSHTTKYDVSTSTTLKLPANQDSAVVFAIPVVIYTYDVWMPDSSGNGSGSFDEQILYQQLTPSFGVLSVDEYNELAGKLTDKEQQAAAPVIGKRPPASVGDPHGYAHSSSELVNYITDNLATHSDIESAIEKQSANIFVSDKAAGYGNDIGLTYSSEDRNGFNVSLSSTCVIKFGNKRGAKLGGGGNASGGYQHISSSSDGVRFSVAYAPISSQNPIRIDRNASQYEAYSTPNSVEHYRSSDYYYTSTAVAYASKQLTNEVDMSDIYGDNTPKYERNEVYVLSFYTSDLTETPPEQPHNFVLERLEKQDNGTYNAVLQWNAKPKNEKRSPDAYNLYIRERNGSQYHLLNQTPIPASKNDEILRYTATDLAKSQYTFYLVPAELETNTDKDGKITGETYREAIVSDNEKLDINIANMINSNGIVIDQQPANVYINQVGREVTFSVKAHDAKSDNPLKYSWEIFDTAKNQFVDIADNDSARTDTLRLKTTQQSIRQPIRCKISKASSSANVYVLYSDVVMVEQEAQHQFDEDGFCRQCGECQPATLNQDKVYEIGNVGQLYWFAALVNGDTSMGSITQKDMYANAVLTSDITLNERIFDENHQLITDGSLRTWTPIGDSRVVSFGTQSYFGGTFDGQGHTIKGMYINEPSDSYLGLFGYVWGKNGKTSIHDVIITDAYLYGKSGVGGIIGCNIDSNTTLDRCMVKGELNGYRGIGGIIGEDYGGAAITNCAHIGSVLADDMAGGLVGNAQTTNIADSYHYGTVDSGYLKGSICGTYYKVQTNNCYYLNTSADDFYGTAKTAEQFKSGEVTFLLNHQVMNGSQVWHQTLGTDKYPVFVGKTVFHRDGTYLNATAPEHEYTNPTDSDDKPTPNPNNKPTVEPTVQPTVIPTVEPTDNNRSSSQTDTVRTGDTQQPILGFAVMSLLSAAAVLGLWLKRKSTKNGNVWKNR